MLTCRLETFNSVIYHQLNENPHLVYAILRAHQDFQSLATFTLVSGLREIQRRKALRSQGERPRPTDVAID
jgi:dynactin complex subunit